jgi:hypothetical protein
MAFTNVLRYQGPKGLLCFSSPRGELLFCASLGPNN